MLKSIWFAGPLLPTVRPIPTTSYWLLVWAIVFCDMSSRLNSSLYMTTSSFPMSMPLTRSAVRVHFLLPMLSHCDLLSQALRCSGICQWLTENFICLSVPKVHGKSFHEHKKEKTIQTGCAFNLGFDLVSHCVLSSRDHGFYRNLCQSDCTRGEEASGEVAPSTSTQYASGNSDSL